MMPPNFGVKTWALMHKRGCGGPAFLMTEKPRPGEPAKSSTVQHLDGSGVDPTSTMKCESCGGQLQRGDLQTQFIEEW